ncbi:MAG: hypothetical protein RL033_6550 [Pseudomonadota bacterium]
MIFGSRSLAVHLLRGALGGAGIFAAMHWSSAHPWLPFVLLPLVLLALRGSPTCWLVGLCETAVSRGNAPPPPHPSPGASEQR